MRGEAGGRPIRPHFVALASLLTLGGAVWTPSFQLPLIAVNIVWSLIFAVPLALACGWRGGLLVGLFGAAPIPFLLWPNNGWANLETLGWGIPDSLFGMRLYPIPALLRAFRGTIWARRFDYDTEISVRLAWQGVPMLAVPTKVRYLTAEEGGVSQFRYFRDNSVLTWMHLRLLIGFLWRIPLLVIRGRNPLKP